jgi:hypothetical protein
LYQLGLPSSRLEIKSVAQAAFFETRKTLLEESLLELCVQLDLKPSNPEGFTKLLKKYISIRNKIFYQPRKKVRNDIIQLYSDA